MSYLSCSDNGSSVLIKDYNNGFRFIRYNLRLAKPRSNSFTEIRRLYYSTIRKNYFSNVLEIIGYYIDSLKFARGSFSLFLDIKLKELINVAYEYSVYISIGG